MAKFYSRRAQTHGTSLGWFQGMAMVVVGRASFVRAVTSPDSADGSIDWWRAIGGLGIAALGVGLLRLLARVERRRSSKTHSRLDTG